MGEKGKLYLVSRDHEDIRISVPFGKVTTLGKLTRSLSPLVNVDPFLKQTLSRNVAEVKSVSESSIEVAVNSVNHVLICRKDGQSLELSKGEKSTMDVGDVLYLLQTPQHSSKLPLLLLLDKPQVQSSLSPTPSSSFRSGSCTPFESPEKKETRDRLVKFGLSLSSADVLFREGFESIESLGFLEEKDIKELHIPLAHKKILLKTDLKNQLGSSAPLQTKDDGESKSPENSAKRKEHPNPSEETNLNQEVESTSQHRQKKRKTQVDDTSNPEEDDSEDSILNPVDFTPTKPSSDTPSLYISLSSSSSSSSSLSPSPSPSGSPPQLPETSSPSALTAPTPTPPEQPIPHPSSSPPQAPLPIATPPAQPTPAKSTRPPPSSTLGRMTRSGASNFVEWLDLDDPDLVLECLESGAFHPLSEDRVVYKDDPDHKGIKSIHYACWGGNVDIVKTLVEYAVHTGSPSAVVVNARQSSNSTPLHYACWSNHLAVAKYLVSEGADVTLVDVKGRGAIHDCVEGEFPEPCLTFLCQEDSRLSKAKDNSGLTPLHLLARCDLVSDDQSLCCAKVLFKYGSPHPPDIMSYVNATDKPSLAKYLLQKKKRGGKRRTPKRGKARRKK